MPDFNVECSPCNGQDAGPSWNDARKRVLAAQSAMEFIINYSWALIIILVMASILVYFALFPSVAASNTCSFASDFGCSDMLLTTNSVTHNTILYMNLTNTQPFPIENPTIIVRVAGSKDTNTTKAYCYPGFVQPGGSMTCTASILVNTYYYQSLSGDVFINSTQCDLSINYSSTASCANAASIVAFGTFYAHVSYNTRFPVSTIYCVGTNSISPFNYAYYAPIYSDGTLGSWTQTTPYPEPMLDAQCSVSDGYIYCVGGFNGIAPQSYAYFAQVTDNGIGGWNSTTPYPVTMVNAGCTTQNGYIYCVGTDSDPPYNYAYTAKLSPTGISQWSNTTTYPISNSSNSCTIYDGYIYCVAVSVGNSNSRASYFAPISASGIGKWTQSTTYSGRDADAGCLASEGYLYCIGSHAVGCSFGCTTNSYYAPIESNGAIGGWTAALGYPSEFYGAGCSVYGGHIYCVGNYPSNKTSVYYANISANGIGVWTPTTSYQTQMYNAYCAAGDTESSYFYATTSVSTSATTTT